MAFPNQKPIFFILCLSMVKTTLSLAQPTRVGFYSRSCPRAGSIIQSTVRAHFRFDPTISPGLLQMFFHDCFVQGCDASVLIDGPSTERTAPPNRNLRGFEVINDAKSQLETACPGVVSCADILALATRDAIVLSNGPNWAVPTGRKDGRVSLASEANNFPGFTESVDVIKQKFAAKGLNTLDVVALIGGHTIGTTACQFFRYRLNNFNNTGAPDRSINPTFLPQLQAICPANGDGTRRVGLDTSSVNRFDTSIFFNLKNGRGILESDQKLWTDTSTRTFVQRFLGIRGRFNAEFAKSMVKMGNIGIKTGSDGEIRRVCNAIN